MADDLTEARRQLVARTASAAELIERSIAAAEAAIARPAFVETSFPAARAAAAAADRAIAGGRDPGVLAGLAVSIKDLFDVAGEITAAGSAILRDAPPANNPQELVNLEAAWAKAAVARDAAALSRIVAPDWTGQNEHGKIMNRAAMIQRTVAGDEKLSSMTNHDVHVRFIGNDHAVVQGMDNETGTMKGVSAATSLGATRKRCRPAG